MRDSGHGLLEEVEGLASPGDNSLECSCSKDDGERRGDVIRIGAPRGPVERIEARFTGNGFSPHRHDTYAIGLTMAGVQTFAYRGESRFSMPGQIIVLHPDELHDGGAGTEAGLRYRMLYIPPELIAAAGDGATLPFVATPVFSDPALAAALAEALCDLDHAPGDLAFADQLGRIADGLACQAGTAPSRSTPLAHRAVDRATRHLRAHSDRVVSSEELEALTDLDRFSLARQFRRITGTSPHRYQVMRRLERARTGMLSGLPIADAAFDAGFADQAHFTRHFKKAFGMTPGRWQALVTG